MYFQCITRYKIVINYYTINNDVWLCINACARVKKCFDDQLTYDRSPGNEKTNVSPLKTDETRTYSLREVNRKEMMNNDVC